MNMKESRHTYKKAKRRLIADTRMKESCLKSAHAEDPIRTSRVMGWLRLVGSMKL